MQNWLMFKQRFLFGVPLKISLFSHYCVAHTINKPFENMWGLKNISKDKKFLYLLNVDMISRNQF